MKYDYTFVVQYFHIATVHSIISMLPKAAMSTLVILPQELDSQSSYIHESLCTYYPCRLRLILGIFYNSAANSTFLSSPFISPVAVFPWLALGLIHYFSWSAAAFIAPSKMVSTINRAYFERTSSRQPTSTMQSITNVDSVAKRKKNIAISGEIAIPKTIIFPTATTPTRYVPKQPLQSISLLAH